MSEHAKLLFMQKKIKQELERDRANTNETLHRQVDSRGPLARWSVADPSGIGRRRACVYSCWYFTDFDPVAFCFTAQ